MRFNEITGYDSIKKQLIHSALKEKVAHAQLFLGPEGGPNLALALAFASYLNCQNPSETDSCGECTGCRKSDKLIHPDMHFAFPVSSTKDVTGKDVVSISFLNEWRNFIIQDPYNNASGWSGYFGNENKQLNISREESRHIIKNLSLKSFEGKYKIMLIWLPEYMHPASANAILKILEEPAPNTIFLLVSNEEKKLLTTILSRTQIVQIRPFSDEEIKQILVQKHFIEEEKASQVSHLVDGNIIEALRLSRDVEDDSHKMFREWMRLCYTGNLIELVKWTDRFSSLTKVGQQTLLQYGLSMMRESLIIHAESPSLSRLMGDELDFLKNFSKVLDKDTIEKLTLEINHSYYHIERNANVKILFLDLSLIIFDTFRKLKNKQVV